MITPSRPYLGLAAGWGLNNSRYWHFFTFSNTSRLFCGWRIDEDEVVLFEIFIKVIIIDRILILVYLLQKICFLNFFNLWYA